MTPTVTVNFGLRFDAYEGVVQENQVSPRINVVWTPNKVLTAHAGYARYFTPPPLTQVNNGAILASLGTTSQPELTTNDPVRAERAHYFDAGFELRPTDSLKFGFDAYYKIATNLLDEGQFGAPIILTSFNYAEAQVKGLELTASYDQGPWSIYANLAWSEAKGTNINSAQFNFAADELAFIAQNYIYLDHNQSVTASAGAAYTFNPGLTGHPSVGRPDLRQRPAPDLVTPTTTGCRPTPRSICPRPRGSRQGHAAPSCASTC